MRLLVRKRCIIFVSVTDNFVAMYWFAFGQIVAIFFWQSLNVLYLQGEYNDYSLYHYYAIRTSKYTDRNFCKTSFRIQDSK